MTASSSFPPRFFTYHLPTLLPDNHYTCLIGSFLFSSSGGSIGVKSVECVYITRKDSVYWLVGQGLGSPTIAGYVPEKLRTCYLLNLQIECIGHVSLAWKTWRIPRDTNLQSTSWCLCYLHSIFFIIVHTESCSTEEGKEEATSPFPLGLIISGPPFWRYS